LPPDRRRSYDHDVAGEWPLTGRAEELRFIGDLTRLRDGPVGVVLAGAAGVGKTRLAREALTAAASRGMTVRWAAATASARGLPFGAFATTLGTAGLDAPGLMQQATEALVAGADRRGVVVGVDDAHLLDELSAVLVHELALRRAAALVLTLRTGDQAPDAVTALWKDGHLRRLELQPLSEAETASALEAALAGPVHSATAKGLWDITRGNMLYLRQLVDGELEAGRLAEVEGVWRWSGRPQLSAGLTELVEARIGRLPDELRQVVEVLAFGEPLEVPLLAALTSAAAVEQAEARRLIEVVAEDQRLQARLIHPLYGEVQRARVGRLRARTLRGRIATELAGTAGRRSGDLLRRAMLALDSDLPPDPQLLNAATHRAAALINLPLAEQLSRAAVAAGGGFEARLTLATVLIGMSGTADAELAALTEHARTDAERVRAAVMRVTSLAFMQARPADAEAVLSAAQEAVAGEHAGLDLTALRATVDAFLGRPRQAMESAAVVLAAPSPPDQAVAYACAAQAAALGMVGRADEIDAVVARGRAAAARSQDAAWILWPITGQHIMGLVAAGELRRADAVVADMGELTNAALAVEVSSFLRGLAHLAHGRVTTALRWLREAHAGFTGFGTAGGWLYACLIMLTRALAISGDTAAARSALDALEAARHPVFAFLLPEAMLARAWVAAAEGAVSEAVAAARDGAGIAKDAGQAALEVVALQAATGFGDRSVADRLAELAIEVKGPRAPAAAAYAAALAAGDGAELQAASDQLGEMGDLLSAADAAAHAAAAYRAEGRTGSAHAAASHAQRLAEACEGAATPALAALDPLPLTMREREIANLAAAGLSNREIAQRLVVSVRTVEGHLYRASAKLGIATRDELAALLRGD
jgi:DNA-binding NarL/FixJ family response regulator